MGQVLCGTCPEDPFVHQTMTQERSEQVASVLLAVAAVGIAVYVVRTPPLRRQVWQLAVTALTRGLPAWLGREVQHAWSESGQRGI